MVDAAVFAERHVGIRAIHAARACICQMSDLRIAARLQNIGEGYDVAFNIGVWVLQAVTNAGLSREMNYSIEGTIAKAIPDGVRVGQIDAVKAIISRALQSYLLENFESGFLDLGGVVVVHDVDPNDGISALQQTRSGVKADKSSIARNQNSHVADITRYESLNPFSRPQTFFATLDTRQSDK
jgi:hypothetical protein